MSLKVENDDKPKFTREDKIKFCMESAEQFGEPNERSRFVHLSEEELDKCVVWFDYLWEK